MRDAGAETRISRPVDVTFSSTQPGLAAVRRGKVRAGIFPWASSSCIPYGDFHHHHLHKPATPEPGDGVRVCLATASLVPSTAHSVQSFTHCTKTNTILSPSIDRPSIARLPTSKVPMPWRPAPPHTSGLPPLFHPTAFSKLRPHHFGRYYQDNSCAQSAVCVDGVLAFAKHSTTAPCLGPPSGGTDRDSARALTCCISNGQTRLNKVLGLSGGWEDHDR